MTRAELLEYAMSLQPEVFDMVEQMYAEQKENDRYTSMKEQAEKEDTAGSKWAYQTLRGGGCKVAAKVDFLETV